MNRQYPDHIEMQEPGRTYRRFHAIALPPFDSVGYCNHAAAAGVGVRFIQHTDQTVAYQLQPGMHAQKVYR